MQTITAKEYKQLKKQRPRFSRSPRSERTEDGITFDSKAELVRYRELKTLRATGFVRWFIRQPKFDLAGVVYSADFLVVLVDGSFRVEEVKGRFAKDTDRQKNFRVEALRRWKRNAAQVKQIYGVTVELVER